MKTNWPDSSNIAWDEDMLAAAQQLGLAVENPAIGASP
jgi:hypothetical protein